MSAQPKYVTQPEFDNALIAFSGHVDHAVNMSRVDFRRDLVETENRLSAKIDSAKADLEAKIDSAKADLEAKIDRSHADLEAKIDSAKADLEAKIDRSHADLQTQIDTMNARLDRVENMGKVNHQMLQLVLDQLSKINKKLGVD